MTNLKVAIGSGAEPLKLTPAQVKGCIDLIESFKQTNGKLKGKMSDWCYKNLKKLYKAHDSNVAAQIAIDKRLVAKDAEGRYLLSRKSAIAEGETELCYVTDFGSPKAKMFYAATGEIVPDADKRGWGYHFEDGKSDVHTQEHEAFLNTPNEVYIIRAKTEDFDAYEIPQVMHDRFAGPVKLNLDLLYEVLVQQPE